MRYFRFQTTIHFSKANQQHHFTDGAVDWPYWHLRRRLGLQQV